MKNPERVRLVNPGSTYPRRGDSEQRSCCCCCCVHAFFQTAFPRCTCESRLAQRTHASSVRAQRASSGSSARGRRGAPTSTSSGARATGQWCRCEDERRRCRARSPEWRARTSRAARRCRRENKRARTSRSASSPGWPVRLHDCPASLRCVRARVAQLAHDAIARVAQEVDDRRTRGHLISFSDAIHVIVYRGVFSRRGV